MVDKLPSPHTYLLLGDAYISIQEVSTDRIHERLLVFLFRHLKGTEWNNLMKTNVFELYWVIQGFLFILSQRKPLRCMSWAWRKTPKVLL